MIYSMQIMLSELQQKRVWEGWLGGEIRAHYFGDLVSQYQSWQHRLTIIALIFSSAAFATILNDTWLPQQWHWLKPVAALIAAIASFISLVFKNEQKALECSDLYIGWSRLALDYQQLWDGMYSEDAAEKLASLDKRGQELSRAGLKLPARKRLMLKWQDYIEEQHRLCVTA